MASNDRKLKPSGSHPEAPALKMAATEADADETMQVNEEEDMDVKDMLKMMMKDMKEVKSMMQENKDIAKEAKEDAASAKESALEAKQAVTDLKSAMADTKSDIQLMQTKMVNRDDIKQLIQEELDKRPEGVHMTQETPSSVAVFGGLHDMTYSAAEEWITHKMKALNISVPDMYYKGDDFKGMVFAEFDNEATVKRVVKAMREQRNGTVSEKVWCKPDRPIEVRAPLSVLLGIAMAFHPMGLLR